ncbi:universal stress protein [Aquimarina sp. BL5]|uniref:universal stress protein n=1 Tax=Aquimarina sp. BL5 TaxID=1714860 RepID=UPI000E5483C2|nr:universal stress protein [Aquimarina sp. BL5]AXT51096.1 universal stress protein [Aquimarina sp. BL5]RKN06046.1 universal stress protein [Aquimarina sp. BL5]
MKKILVTTDFSDRAWNAFVYAIDLYRDSPCEFHILNTYDLNSVRLATTLSSQRVGYFYESIKIESEQGLKMTLEDIKNSQPAEHHTFKTVSKSGILTKILQQMTEKNQFDLIVMSSKGTTGSKHIFLGSSVKRVLENNFYCPILIIPEDAYFERIKNIAFATDFERIYHKSEIKPIIDLAKNNDATVRMIHVYDGPKLSLTQNYNSTTLENFFKNVRFDFHVMPEFSTIEKGIQTFIEELEIDLLSMIKYEHSFIERLTREAIIEKITFNTKIPFLIIPADHI